VRTVGVGIGGGSFGFYDDVVSQPLYDALRKRPYPRDAGIRIDAGRISIFWSFGAFPARIRWWFGARSVNFLQVLPGARTATATTAFPVRETHIWIPCWILLLLAAPYPIYRLFNISSDRDRRRFASGQCVACGYDLRHTPDRCPECGLVPAPVVPSKPMLRGIWVRVCLYPIGVAVFMLVFVEGYFWYYRK
jgi:hypothetical protein